MEEMRPTSLLVPTEETTIIHFHRFVIELLRWHKVCELGGDTLQRPPVVALNDDTIIMMNEGIAQCPGVLCNV